MGVASSDRFLHSLCGCSGAAHNVTTVFFLIPRVLKIESDIPTGKLTIRSAVFLSEGYGGTILFYGYLSATTGMPWILLYIHLNPKMQSKASPPSARMRCAQGRASRRAHVLQEAAAQEHGKAAEEEAKQHMQQGREEELQLPCQARPSARALREAAEASSPLSSLSSP